MVEPAGRFAEVESDPELVESYARALAAGDGDAPHFAADLRRAFLSRRRELEAASRTTPPPPPRSARTPRLEGRLAKQPRLDKQRPLRRLTTTTMVVILLVVGARVIRSCVKITDELDDDRGGAVEQSDEEPVYGIGEVPEEDKEEGEREGRDR